MLCAVHVWNVCAGFKSKGCAAQLLPHTAHGRAARQDMRAVYMGAIQDWLRCTGCLMACCAQASAGGAFAQTHFDVA